jgi:WD40 repeat protein
MDGHTMWVSDLTAWRAADGSDRLASAGADGTARIWDPETGRPVCAPLTGHDGAVHAITSWTLADGSARVASVDDGGLIRVWDADVGDLASTFPTGEARGLGSLASWVAADGAIRLAFGAANGAVVLLDPDNGAIVARLSGHRVWVHTLVAWVNPDGAVRLGSASADGTIRVWDPQAAAPVGVPIEHGRAMASAGGLAAWEGSDGRWRLASAIDETVRVWDAETGAPADEFSVRQPAGLWALTSWTSVDGRGRLAAAGDGATVRVWDAETGASLGEPLTGHTATVWELASWRTADGHVRLASGGDDGLIFRWDGNLLAAHGQPLQGHAGWIPSLVAWTASDGAARLASGGADSTVRVWDPDRGTSLAELETAPVGCTWILALAAWTTPDGGTRVAFAGNDPNVYVWNPDGAVDVLPMSHPGWIRSLTTWTDPGGRRWLASGGVDGTIQIWDVDAGAARSPIAAHSGWVRSMVNWVDPAGRTMLASAGASDGTIRVWDAETGAAVGTPLTGHERGIWTVTVWTGPDGQVRLGSTGADGTIRLWDPQRGRSIRTIDVGPTTMRSLSDTAATEDTLDRQRLADAIADQISRTSGPTDGPLVVSIEGPWGSGKTTLMKLVRQRLSERQERPSPRPGRPRPLTPRAALALIRESGRERSPVAAERTAGPGSTVTIWFNPWVHQSGEQVWAGLMHEIVEGVSSVLYPTESARHRYWFARNLAHTDRHALRQTLRRRVISPLLGVALAAVVAQLAIAVAEFNRPVTLFGRTLTAPTLALIVAGLFLLAGIAHTAARYLWSPAAHLLPANLLHGPVADSADSADDRVVDPLRRARTGALYLYQHDISNVVDDLAAKGHDLVVFIDDLDRCRPSTVVEVFEAVNLLLSGVVSRGDPRTHFVVGLDPQVVAGYLDRVYDAPGRSEPAAHGDDPSTGWAFLRKLIQLPVLIPEVPDVSLVRFVDQVTGGSFGATTATPRPHIPKPRPGSPTFIAAPPSTMDKAVPVARTPVETIPWRTLEQHPDVRAALAARLTAQPDRSLREAKRLINVWQLYVRLAASTNPMRQPAPVQRAQHLIALAEIVTRWPALQSSLHRRIGDRRGLQILADSVTDDQTWQQAVLLLELGQDRHHKALAHLRELLRDHDGRAVADLAGMLL